MLRAPDKTLMPWLVLLLVLTLWPGAVAAEGLKISFAAKAEVPGDMIKIRDITSSITGQPQGVLDRLGDIVVGPAPAPGRTKVISAREINALLTFDNLGLEKLQARIPPRIVVARGSNRITQEMMDRAFRDGVEENLPYAPDHVEVVNVKTPREMILPPGDLEILPRISGSSRMPGRVTMNLDFMINGTLVESKRVSGLVKFFQSAVVSARPLPRGKVLEEDDLTVVRRQIRSSRNRYYEDPEQVVGMVVKRAILSGHPIKPDYIDERVLVKRGDRVTLVAQKGRLSITASGVIRDSKGILNDQVKVLNLTTKQEVYGQLVSADTVKVNF